MPQSLKSLGWVAYPAARTASRLAVQQPGERTLASRVQCSTSYPRNWIECMPIQQPNQCHLFQRLSMQINKQIGPDPISQPKQSSYNILEALVDAMNTWERRNSAIKRQLKRSVLTSISSIFRRNRELFEDYPWGFTTILGRKI